MPFLLRAAVVGGAAYHVGKKRQQGRDAEAAQQQQIDDLQYSRISRLSSRRPRRLLLPPLRTASEDGMAKLTQLKSLLDQGVLTQAEFDMQKQKILMSM